MTESKGFQTEPFYVVFDAGPGHVAGRFIETETADGRGVGVGTWEAGEPWWRLGPFVEASVLDALRQAVDAHIKITAAMRGGGRTPEKAIDTMIRIRQQLGM